MEVNKDNNYNGTESWALSTLKGTVYIGAIGALGVTIGANIREHNFDREALTVFVGGAVTGAVAGTLKYLLPKTNKDSSCCLRFAKGVIESALDLGASLTVLSQKLL